MNKYIYALLFAAWLFLAMILLWYEGYKMVHELSEKDKKYDWILYLLFVGISIVLVILIF